MLFEIKEICIFYQKLNKPDTSSDTIRALCYIRYGHCDQLLCFFRKRTGTERIDTGPKGLIKFAYDAIYQMGKGTLLMFTKQ